jgi:hypothetical protein
MLCFMPVTVRIDGLRELLYQQDALNSGLQRPSLPIRTIPCPGSGGRGIDGESMKVAP